MSSLPNSKWPQWLKKDFFWDILTDKNLQVHNVRMATKPGDNFASIMYRALVGPADDPAKSISLIVKSDPSLGLSEDFTKNFNFFGKEIEMYNKIVPGLEKLYRDIGKHVVFGPKCLKYIKTPLNVIVLDDLTKQGYVMGNRQEGFNLEHMQMALAKLAEFHAASVIFKDTAEDFEESFYKGLYNESSRNVFNQHDLDVNYNFIVNEVMSKWKQNWDILNKINSWNGSGVITEMIKLYKPNPNNGFNVLCHGDYWINNIMFKYEDGKPVDLKLLDFQLSTWNSPVIDLLYLIVTSAACDIKVKYFDYFIQYYHKKLIETLDLFEYPEKKLPSLKELHLDVLNRGFYGVYTSFTSLPMVLSESSPDTSIDNLVSQSKSGREFKRKIYSNPRYIRAMQDILPFFDQKGLMEIEKE